MIKLRQIILYLLITLCFTGCVFLEPPGPRIDWEKRASFEAHFQAGMDIDEVEATLLEVNGEVILLQETSLEDGDIVASYETKRSVSGKEVYLFRFSPDGVLITLIAPIN